MPLGIDVKKIKITEEKQKTGDALKSTQFRPRTRTSSLQGKQRGNKFLLWATRINRSTLYLIIFLLPLFFLPWTANVLDFNKQALLLFLVFLSLLAWLTKTLLQGTIRIRLSFLYIPAAILLVVTALASFFSFYSYASFWGWPLKVNQSFFSLLGLSLFFFLFLNSFAIEKKQEGSKKREDIVSALFVLCISVGLTALFGILQLFNRFLFHWPFARMSDFNTIGTSNAWALFLAAFLPILISLLYFVRKDIFKWSLRIIFLLCLFGLFLVNFWAAWLVLLAGMALVLVFAIYSKGESEKAITEFEIIAGFSE